MRRNLWCHVLSSLALSAVGALGACHSAADDDQAELQALLRDEELHQVPPSAAQQSAQGTGAVSRTDAAPEAVPAPPPVTLNWRFDDCSPLQTQRHGDIARRTAQKEAGHRQHQETQQRHGVGIVWPQ